MKKVAIFTRFFCVHSFSSQDAKVDQGVHLFISDEHVKQSKMLQNNIFK